MFLRLIIIVIFLSFNLNATDCEKPKMPSDEIWNSWLEDIKLEAIQLGITKKTVSKYLKNILYSRIFIYFSVFSLNSFLL